MASPDKSPSLMMACMVTNVIALVVVSILFVSDVSLNSLLGCSCGGCFLCMDNLIIEFVSIGFCVIGVVGNATLHMGLTATAAAWYITTATMLIGVISKQDWLEGSWIVLLLFSVFLVTINFSLILALRNGTITKEDGLCCKGCCNDCCQFRKEDARDGKGLCLPYNDKLIITSLALSTMATILSAWVSGSMILTSVGCMALLQILWCSRCSSKLLICGAVGMSILCFLAHVSFGTYLLWFFQNNEGGCYMWNPYYSYDDDVTSLDQEEGCVERWSRVTIAFICGLLWAGVAMSMGIFVYSGRYAMWEAKYTSTTTAE